MLERLTIHKLVMLGDEAVGKTALTIQFTVNHFVETYDPTIEDSYRKRIEVDGQPCIVEVLDTAGQEEYTALRNHWISEGEGFLLVYSVSSRNSFTKIQKIHQQIQRVKEFSLSEVPTGASGASGQPPLILVGNQCDRVTEREVSHQEGFALARDLGCDFVEVSAKNFFSVENAFYNVIRNLREQQRDTRPEKRKRVPVVGKSPSCTPYHVSNQGGWFHGRMEKCKCTVL